MQDGNSLNFSSFQHIPVLGNQVLESIATLPEDLLNGGLVIDTTVGGGGHSNLILEKFPEVRLLGLDQDPHARESASKKLNHFRSRSEIRAANFSDFNPDKKAIVVLADLGVSSPQLDTPERGFSFRFDGPLDMRMNPESRLNAAALIENLDEQELANTIYKFGEERFSRRIARKIKDDLSSQGPYSGTSAFAYAIAGCYPKKLRNGRVHPATKTFQALRIAVNNELEALDKLLIQAPEWLIPGGILIIISFHSLEDKKVKYAFLNDNRLERITRKPIVAAESEITKNKRSRSAKCRIAKRILDKDI